MSDTAKQLVTDLSTEIINPLIGLLFAIALVYFIYGVVQFMANADNDTAREKGKQHLMYSIIGLVIMVGVWGILQLIISSLGPGVTAPEGFDQLQ
ncbi:MAG: pilin [Candidatus Paceibacterota bacterium]